MIKKNLVGQKFNKLTAVRLEIGEHKIKDNTTYYCTCDCGGDGYFKSGSLTKGNNGSCGCEASGAKSLIGLKFGKLTVMKEVPRKQVSPLPRNQNRAKEWSCDCDCGNKNIIVQTDNLNSGNTKSCGCIRIETAIKTLDKLNQEIDENSEHPRKLAAQRPYKEHYDDGDITLEKFMEISQQNCYYCDNPPTNAHTHKRKILNKYTAEDCIFKYNGLDRINNEENHLLNNCYVCCKYCNYLKTNMLLDTFLKLIKVIAEFDQGRKLLNFYNIPSLQSLQKEMMDKGFYIKPSSKFHQYLEYIASPFCAGLKNRWQKYKDGLTFEQFYYLSNFNCYYCGKEPSNTIKYEENGENKEYHYSGCDRIDQQLNHAINNVVPCCETCNMAKQELHQNDFFRIVYKIYNNLKYKNII